MSNALPRSATTVALLADVPSTGHVGEAGAQRFALQGDSVGVRSAAFVAFARKEVDAGRKVVALYPAWQDSDAQRAINFARGALRTDHIAGVGVNLSPLALSLIADQLSYLAPYLPPGMVAALSDELPKHLLAGAWLRTVSNLSTLPTSLKQHMGSYAPTVSFLAYCAPNTQVGRLRPAEVARRLPFRPVQPVQLLCSTPDPGITKLFDENLPQAIQPVATRTLPAQPLGPAYWGTDKYVEFVALSAHPQALAYAAGAIRAAACSWCGEPVSAQQCPFCRGNSTGKPIRAHQTGSAPPRGGRPPAPSPQNPPSPQRPQRAQNPPGLPTGPQIQPHQAPRPAPPGPPQPGGAPTPPGPPASGAPAHQSGSAPSGTPTAQGTPPRRSGHRPPPSPGRTEGPEFQDRSPQPEPPRTYSR